MTTLGIICPCYNEQEILDISYQKLNTLLEELKVQKKISESSFVLLVNDGSRDKTWNIITRIHQTNNRFKALNLSTNVGHQNAIMAGMMTAKDKCDAIITMDVDLQDDINCIPEMLEAYEKGYDIVYGVKQSREGDSFMKKNTAMLFYKIQHAMGVKAVYNHADFRLMSRKSLGFLSQYNEKNLYLRGLIPMLGCNSTTVDDVISTRVAGQSKYTIHKMLKLAVDGITSFSTKPISLIVGFGFFCLIICAIIVVHTLYAYFSGITIPGWTSLMISIWFLVGVLLVCIGIIGIYIGKIYIEVKNRPLYNIDTILWN